jgi:hypothetical protein
MTIDGDFAGLPGNFGYAGARSHGRMSTGLYAAAGEVVNVTFPARIVGQNVYVLIGGHTDSLWGKSTLDRHPRIHRWWLVDNTPMQVGNAFGGSIYIAIAAGATLGQFNVSIEHAVPAPQYVHGVTNIQDWQMYIRANPAPWTELISDHFILTVPSSEIRNLDNPDDVMDFWSEVLQVEHNLSGYTPWPRVERAVFDIQISAGWMHSGYPFMAHTASVAGVVNATQMRSSGDWGMFHELGHNHQWMPSTLPGTTETTCNLYSVKVMTDVVGVNLSQGHSALNTNSRLSRTQTYFQGGSQISQWSVWIALETYLQIQEEFGWEPITQALTAYYNMSNSPSSSDAEFNEWTLQISYSTGYNLAPYHQAWGFPLTQATHAALAHLPVWLTDPPRLAGLYEYDAIIRTNNATNVTNTTALLQFGVYDNGTNSNITVCYGISDGGTTVSLWDVCTQIGVVAVGIQNYSVSNLSAATSYHFRLFGSNSNADSWSEQSRSFTTLS